MDNNDSILYKDFFDQLSAGAIVTDATGTIKKVNPYFLELSEFESIDVLGKNIGHFLDGTYESNACWEGEIHIKKKNGRSDLQWLYINPINDTTGQTIFLSFILRDLRVSGIDPLTKLPNRYFLTQQLDKTLNQSKVQSSLAAVLFVDLDRFKMINDTLGHAYGDLLLLEAALRIENAIGTDNFIVRMGGDEFVCVLANLQNESEAAQYAEAILEVFKKPFLLKETEIYVTVSIGISMYPFDGDDAETLLTNADSAMYRAKNSGRNQYEKARADINAASFEKLMLENSLRKALENEELTLYFQPQIDLKTNEVKSMEALIRWEHPDFGLISPGDFIPIAEETGLILPIGDWVIKTACQKLREWQNEGYSPVRISVNLSAAQLLQSGFIGHLDSVLKETSLDPSLLELEITENIIMRDVKTALDTLHRIKKRGVTISIDDFGTGYSSLSYLKDLPVDTLKIDRSFIKDIDKNANSAAFTKAITALGHELDLRVVAEGVETFKQLSIVKQQSCDVVQGFYFSKPLPSHQAIQFLEQSQKTINIPKSL